MTQGKKKRRIRISRVIPILVVIVFLIINYIVIPPKVSKNAEKYRFNPFNIAGLESITVDENRIVYKFSSLSRTFTMIGVVSKGTSINGFYLTEYKGNPFYEKNINSDNRVYFSITSKYIVLNRNGQEDMEGLKIMKNKKGTYIWGFDQPDIEFIKYDYEENVLHGIRQEYNDGWDKPEKYSNTIGYFE